MSFHAVFITLGVASFICCRASGRPRCNTVRWHAFSERKKANQQFLIYTVLLQQPREVKVLLSLLKHSCSYLEIFSTQSQIQIDGLKFTKYETDIITFEVATGC